MTLFLLELAADVQRVGDVMAVAVRKFQKLFVQSHHYVS